MIGNNNPMRNPQIAIKNGLSRRGRHLPEEQKKKISESNKGKMCGSKNPMFGKHHLKATKLKMSISHMGNLSNTGKHLSEETKLKMSIVGKGRKQSCEHVTKRTERLKGEGNPQWKGGISFEPYCPKFNDRFKERVRAFFGYQCVECGIMQNGTKLSVHHVNFDKGTCCNNSIPLFVTLCKVCHPKTNHNRLFWEYWFTEMINHQFGGKCYLTEVKND